MRLLILLLAILNIGFVNSAYSLNAAPPPPSITGPSTGTVGSTSTFAYADLGVIGDPYWSITGGFVSSQTLSGGSYSCVVQWTAAGTGVVNFYDGSSLMGSKNVTITGSAIPSAPTAISATSITTTSFTANWNAVSGATSYKLDVSSTNNFSLILSGYNDLSVTTNTKSVTGLSSGTLYYYRVQAVNASGTSGESNTITVTTTATVPAAPVSTAATAMTSSSFTANWNASSGATSYRLDVSKDNFATYVSTYNNLTVSITNQLVTSLLPGTTYQYRVRAVNAAGTSPNSTTQSATTLIDNNENYVMTNTILVAHQDVNTVSGLQIDLGKRSQVYQYIDGLGRLMQSVVTMGSFNKKDIVQPIAYDGFGREALKYLPYVSTGSNGWFKNNFVGKDAAGYTTSDQYVFYNTGSSVIAQSTFPYSETRFEPSPLNRVIEQGAVGSFWQPDVSDSYAIPSDRSIKMAYEFNAASEVLLWTYTNPTTSYPFGIVNASSGATPVYYGVNQLYRTRTKDEQRNEIIEYKDKDGRIVLKRVQAITTANASTIDTNKDINWASTYYIYNDFGSLVCVIPPEATKQLANAYYQSGATDATKDTFLKQWAFRYAYDARRRMAKKQVPGAKPVYMVYDIRDRLILTQDGNQRRTSTGTIKKEWIYTKYDVLNRPIITGLYIHALNDTSQSEMQTYVNIQMNPLVNINLLYEDYLSTATTTHGYTNRTFPNITSAGSIVYTVTYYDNYSFVTNLSLGAAYNFVTNDISGQQTVNNTHVVGQVTGSKVNILNSTNYLWNVNYYDDKYRAIQTISQNTKAGTIRTTNVLDFPGRVLTTKRTYLVNGVSTNIKETFAYDHASRLISVKHSTNGAADVMIAKNDYNEIGQLIDKQLHSTDFTSFKQSVDYRYNIRGWLTKMNESDITAIASGETLPDYFGMELAYDNVFTSVSATAQFNGNISAVKWSSGLGQGNKQQAYSYGYDPLNRLLNSNHYKNVASVWSADNSNQESGFSYDLNGNIKGLTRKGQLTTTLDNLTYGYTGNKLNYVHDTGDATKGFINGNTGTDDYSYDVNGNLTIDKNKGITAIAYNHLNLPRQVNKGATDYIVYTYDAEGQKLSQQVFGATPKTTDYIGEFVYEGTTPVLKMINHAEGRVLPDGANWEYQYHLKDHLGNVRVTFTAKTPTALNYTANFESATNTDFTNYSRSAFDLVDHTDAGTVSTYVQTLTGGNNNRVGVAKSFAVMPGDQITISAWAKYMNLTTTPNTNTLIASLSSIFGVSSSSTGEQLKLYNGLNSYAGTVASGDHYQDDEGAPKAFVTILFFDKDYNFLDAAWKQITTVGSQTSPSVKQPPHDFMTKTASAKEQGYAYAFISNEHYNNVTLYFDDVTMTHTPSAIVQMDDYYAFGLTYNSYSRENSTLDDYKYNGKEEQTELGLGWLDYGMRMYEPELGRFFTQDRFSEKYSSLNPYQYAANNPILFIDVNGDSINVAEQYRSQFTQALQSIFGSNASSFTYSAAGNLIFTGNSEDFNEAESSVFNDMNGVMGETTTTNIIFEKSHTITDNDGNKLTIDPSKSGGEATALVGENKISQNYVVIDPVKTSTGNSYEVTDAYYKTPVDPKGPPRFNITSQTLSLENRTLHGLGHVIHRGESQDKVIDFDNKTRTITKGVNSLGYYPSPLQKRNYDEHHNRTVKSDVYGN